MTILFQSRASRLADVLTDREINDIAMSSTADINGAELIKGSKKSENEIYATKSNGDGAVRSNDKPPKRINYATVDQSGTVSITPK